MMAAFSSSTRRLALVLILLVSTLGCNLLVQPGNISQPPRQAAPGDLLLPTAAEPVPPTPTATRVIEAYLPSPTRTPTSTLVPTDPPPPTLTPPAPTPLPPAPVTRRVVIISVDGLRPDALDQTHTPTLDRLRSQGAYTADARTVLPSVTLVSHASMLGGMTPEKHGIYWNDFRPELGKINGPTLFSVAHDAGLSTAMVVGKPKLEHLVLPGSVDSYIFAGSRDDEVAAKALELLQGEPPAVLFIHFPDTDAVGHSSGWMSLPQLQTVSHVDTLIGQIADALDLSDTLLIVTSDHGGTGTGHGGDTPEETRIPWLAVGPGIPAGLVLSPPLHTYDTAAAALYALGLPIPPEWDGRPPAELGVR